MDQILMNPTTPDLILRSKASTRIASLFLFVSFLALFVWLAQKPSEDPLILQFLSFAFFAGMVIMTLYNVLGTFTTVTFDGQLFTCHKLLHQTTRVQLLEVSKVTHQSWPNRLTLLSAQDVRLLAISETLPGFSRLFDLLREIRPDLWPLTGSVSFRIKRSFVLSALLVPLVINFFLLAILASMTPLTPTLYGLATIGTLAILDLTRRQVIGLELTTDRITLTFPFKTLRLSFSAITQVVLNLPGENQATHCLLTIHVGEKKRYFIRAFELDEVLLFDKFRSLMPTKAFRASSLLEKRGMQTKR